MNSVMESAKEVLRIEAEAILDLQSRIGSEFEAAVEMISKCSGKVIITGIGKSGHIARKIASTFTSTGTPAIFLHPAESVHGDMGIIGREDLVIAISYGGESAELDSILHVIARKNLNCIGITGEPKSTLGRASQLVLNVKVKKEACPLGLAPTASSTATLALGDALAMAVLRFKGFGPEDFAENHPGGKLGRRLLTRVSDLMHSGRALPLVSHNMPMKQVVSIMTSGEVRGVAGVLSEDKKLIGVITDGDLRRRLEKSQNPLEGNASDIMTLHPKSISSNELAEKALYLMESHSIQMLFVLDGDQGGEKVPIGVIHFHDLLRANIR